MRALPQVLALLGGVLAGALAHAGSPSWETPEADDRKTFAPYLDSDAARFLVLAGPPAEGSPADAGDVQAILRLQKATSATRRAQAEDDGDALYARFADAFGRPLDRAHTPYTIRLLNRLERTVARPVFAAKDLYRRARPYQRLTLARACGRGSAPSADPDVAGRTSYPSGHAAYGWMAVQALAELAPQRAPALLQRGIDYGESRLVCGVHFPSDVEAGRLVATAVYERVRGVADFQRDFACAAAELRADGQATDLALAERCGAAPAVRPAGP
ncbi:MAG: phosphatase PAP2 family protein [Solimonas sp.]